MILANESATREFLAYFSLLAVTWLSDNFLFDIALNLGFYNNEENLWMVHRVVDFGPLVIGVCIAHLIGQLTYAGLFTITFFGVSCFHQVLWFRSGLKIEAHFVSWLDYGFHLLKPSLVTCITLFVVAQLTKRLSAFRQQAGSTGRSKAAPLN